MTKQLSAQKLYRFFIGYFIAIGVSAILQALEYHYGLYMYWGVPVTSIVVFSLWEALFRKERPFDYQYILAGVFPSIFIAFFAAG
jgi:hypothetical protein